MSVKMHDTEVRILLCCCPHTSQGHQMFPADHKGQLAVSQNLPCPVLNLVKHPGGIPDGKLQIPAVKYFKICQVFFLIRTVCLKAIGFIPDGLASKPGSRPEGCGGVKRRSEYDNTRLLIFPAASDKIHNIFTQHLSASPPHKPAGQRLPHEAWADNIWCVSPEASI